jgi:hypothetical protein
MEPTPTPNPIEMGAKMRSSAPKKVSRFLPYRSKSGGSLEKYIDFSEGATGETYKGWLLDIFREDPSGLNSRDSIEKSYEDENGLLSLLSTSKPIFYDNLEYKWRGIVYMFPIFQLENYFFTLFPDEEEISIGNDTTFSSEAIEELRENWVKMEVKASYKRTHTAPVEYSTIAPDFIINLSNVNTEDMETIAQAAFNMDFSVLYVAQYDNIFWNKENDADVQVAGEYQEEPAVYFLAKKGSIKGAREVVIEMIKERYSFPGIKEMEKEQMELAMSDGEPLSQEFKESMESTGHFIKTVTILINGKSPKVYQLDVY